MPRARFPLMRGLMCSCFLALMALMLIAVAVVAAAGAHPEGVDWNGWPADGWPNDDWSSLPACPPGQGRPTPTEPCQLCSYGYYSPGGLVGPCLQCPAHRVTIAPGATECGCKPGTGTLTINEGPCKPCANGTYSPGGSMSPCTRCPSSAFMVTPVRATRVSQCTCKPGFGTTVDFPLSCQLCPIGTYANALAEIDGIPGVPPKGGKGISGGLAGATLRPCKPCCPQGVGTCPMTTKAAGSTSYADCIPAPPPVQQYCCGGATCTYPVAVPPNSLSPTAAAVAAAAAAQPYFRELYEGASVMASLPENQLQSNGLPVYNTDEDGSLGAMPVGRIVVGNRRRRRRWDDWQNGNGDDQWNSGGNDWGSGSSSGGGWGSGSSSGGWGSGSSSWGGSSGSSSWGGGSSSWGGGSSGWGGTKSAGRGAAISGGGAAGDQAGTGGSVAVSSVIPQAWWGRLGPPTDLSVCSAYPRNSATIPGTLTANTPWLVSYWADSTNDGCQYTTSSFLITGCTGSQIAPNLILTAAHCVDAGLKQRSTSSDFVNCQNIQLVGMEACYDYDRVPGGDFRCTDPVDAIGVSFYPQNTTGSPFDYAIVFIGPADARQGPFYQYNFIQNFPGILTSTTNTFQAMSYSGDGSNATTTSSGRCGCQVCPSIPCGRARTGPAPGPPTIDPRNPTNGAVNPKLEACAGSSGSCMTINGRTCCVGTMSYEYLNTAGPCANGCTNYWSTLSVSQPLVSLWYNVSLPLPKPPTVIG